MQLLPLAKLTVPQFYRLKIRKGQSNENTDRLALILTFFAWLVAAVVVGGIYIYNRQQTREDTRQRLLEIAALGVQRLDGDLACHPGRSCTDGFRRIPHLPGLAATNPG